MGLSPQSIRSNVLIQMNGEYVKKEVILTLSEGWNDRQLSYFRKMVQQGGNVRINGNLFEITINENILNSRGDPILVHNFAVTLTWFAAGYALVEAPIVIETLKVGVVVGAVVITELISPGSTGIVKELEDITFTNRYGNK